MDMTSLVAQGSATPRVLQHTEAIRNEQVSVALMLLYLNGYEVQLQARQRPLASAAHEILEDIEVSRRIDIWSCSTKAGGIFAPYQRQILKTGSLTTKQEDSVWIRRSSNLEIST